MFQKMIPLFQSCHDDFQRVANIPKAELPQCPVGPKAVALDQEVSWGSIAAQLSEKQCFRLLFLSRNVRFM